MENNRGANGTFSPNPQNGNLGGNRITCKKIATKTASARTPYFALSNNSFLQRCRRAAEEAVPGTSRQQYDAPLGVFFREYPDILSDAENRASVGRTIQKLRDYLKNLEDKMEELL